MPRGKKRRLAAALDSLCDANRSSEDALVKEDIVDTTRDAIYRPPVSQDEDCNEPQLEVIEMHCDLRWVTVLTAQALNLVPASFLSRRQHYITNIVSHCIERDFTSEEMAVLIQSAEGVFENITYLQTPKSELL